MPIVDAPELAGLTFLAGTGDLIFTRGSNSETGVADTFLISVVGEGGIGDVTITDREGEVAERGFEAGKRQTGPADVAIRFTDRRSLEAFVLSAAELLGEARRDVARGNSLDVKDAETLMEGLEG